MKSLHTIEQSIFDVDGFRVELSSPTSGHADYWQNRFSGDRTVAEFKARFSQRYPGVDIVVFDAIGRPVHGNYLLRNLRATYAFDWIKGAFEAYHESFLEQVDEIVSLRDALAAAKVVPEDPDPYEILGLQSGCSDEEIAMAYKRKISRIHPDKLGGLDEALVALANQRAQLINRARDEILAQRNASKVA